MRTFLLLVLLALTGCGTAPAVLGTPSPTPVVIDENPSPEPTCDDRDGFCAPEGDQYRVHVTVTALTPTVRPGDVLRVEVASDCGPGATFVSLEYRPPGERYARSVPLSAGAEGANQRFPARVVVPADATPQRAHVLASTNCSHLAEAGSDYADVRIVARHLPRTG